MVLQHERQSSPTLCDESKVLVNASDARKFASKSNKFGPSSYGLEPWVCTFCNINNHIVDTCYRKHGLPPHLQRTNSSQVNSAAHEGSEFGNDSSATLDKGTPPSLTHDQYTKLIALI
jgi:hypothetical protein